MEWDGTDPANERLDQVALIVTPSPPTYNHLLRLGQIAASSGEVDLASPSTGVAAAATSVRVTVRGTGGGTRHEWTIRVRRTGSA